jgi:hypothetical protein
VCGSQWAPLHIDLTWKMSKGRRPLVKAVLPKQGAGYILKDARKLVEIVNYHWDQYCWHTHNAKALAIFERKQCLRACFRNRNEPGGSFGGVSRLLSFCVSPNSSSTKAVSMVELPRFGVPRKTMLDVALNIENKCGIFWAWSKALYVSEIYHSGYCRIFTLFTISPPTPLHMKIIGLGSHPSRCSIRDCSKLCASSSRALVLVPSPDKDEMVAVL